MSLLDQLICYSHQQSLILLSVRCCFEDDQNDLENLSPSVISQPKSPEQSIKDEKTRQSKSIEKLMCKINSWKPINQQESMKRQILRFFHLFENKLRKKTYDFWVKFQKIAEAKPMVSNYGKLQKGFQFLAAFLINHQQKYIAQLSIKQQFRLIYKRYQRSKSCGKICNILHMVAIRQAYQPFTAIKSILSRNLKCDLFVSTIIWLFKDRITDHFRKISQTHKISKSQCTFQGGGQGKVYQVTVNCFKSSALGKDKPLCRVQDWYFDELMLWKYQIPPPRVLGMMSQEFEGSQPQNSDNVLFIEKPIFRYKKNSLKIIRAKQKPKHNNNSSFISPQRCSSFHFLMNQQQVVENQITIKRSTKESNINGISEFTGTNSNDSHYKYHQKQQQHHWRKDRQTLASIIDNISASPACSHCQINRERSIVKKVNLHDVFLLEQTQINDRTTEQSQMIPQILKERTPSMIKKHIGEIKNKKKKDNRVRSWQKIGLAQRQNIDNIKTIIRKSNQKELRQLKSKNQQCRKKIKISLRN